LTAPNGVAVDSSGNVYVTSQAGVYEFNPTGTTVLHFAALRQASAITIAPNGTVYLAAGSTINLTSGISTAGGVYTFTAGVLTPIVNDALFSSRVSGIVVGGDGNLYVSDVLNSVIRQVTPAGVVKTVAGVTAATIGTAPGGLPGSINSPTGMALLSTSSSVSLAVVDSFEHSILRVDLP
jgi:streptogramin lyase